MSWAEVPLLPELLIFTFDMKSNSQPESEQLLSTMLYKVGSEHCGIYFDEDVLIIEHNSRSFVARVSTINSNTETVTSYLLSCTMYTSIMKEVSYPKWHPQNTTTSVVGRRYYHGPTKRLGKAAAREGCSPSFFPPHLRPRCLSTHFHVRKAQAQLERMSV